MDRHTVSKYFKWLVAQGYLTLDEKGEYYNITVLGKDEANIIFFDTLNILLNVFRRHAIDIYQYLYSRYCANGKKSFIAATNDMKNYIGIATTTSSNDAVINDTLDILSRLGLLSFHKIYNEDNKELREFFWVKDRLPEKVED